MPVDERALQALRPLTSHAAEMAERSTAGTLDLAFRHADSPAFEGEVPSVALACAVWGPLIVGESAVAGVELVVAGPESARNYDAAAPLAQARGSSSRGGPRPAARPGIAGPLGTRTPHASQLEVTAVHSSGDLASSG